MANTIYNQNVVSSDKETKTQTKAAMDAILVVAALAAVFFFFFFKKTKTSGPRLPPGPKTLPIIGNLHQMEKYNLQRFLYRLSKTYGPVFKLKLGSRNFVFISSAKLAKELLKNQDPNFVNRPLFKGQQTMSYGGQDLAMNQFNSYYREMRKMCIMNLFAPSRIDAFRPIRAEECRRMLDRIAEAAEKLEVIDLSELLLSFTNSAVCRTAFGKRYNDYGDEMRRFIKILYETQALFGTLAISDLIPWLGWLDNFTGLNARIKKAFKEQDDYFEELLQEALNPNRVKPETESVMDALIQIYKDQPFTTEFTLENVKAMVMDVIVAGTDTAAAVIVWAMTFLMKNPEMLKRVQHEVRSVVGDRGYANEDDIQNLPYLRAIIKETLRLEPVIPILLHREATESTVIDGYKIPAKTILQVNAWAVSRDEEAWGEKADVFDPERFLKRDVDYKGQDFELLPFGSGRRMCPGMRLGVAMVETPFANLLYRFDFSLPAGMKAEDIKMDVQEGLAMHKKDHLMLVPKLVN